MLAPETRRTGFLLRSFALFPVRGNLSPRPYPRGSAPLGLSLTVTFSVTPILTMLFIMAVHVLLPTRDFQFLCGLLSNRLFNLLDDCVYVSS